MPNPSFFYFYFAPKNIKSILRIISQFQLRLMHKLASLICNKILTQPPTWHLVLLQITQFKSIKARKEKEIGRERERGDREIFSWPPFAIAHCHSHNRTHCSISISIAIPSQATLSPPRHTSLPVPQWPHTYARSMSACLRSRCCCWAGAGAHIASWIVSRLHKTSFGATQQLIKIDAGSAAICTCKLYACHSAAGNRVGDQAQPHRGALGTRYGVHCEWELRIT